MKNVLAALILGFAISSAFAKGLGISSVVYAERFNGLAEQMHAPMRLQLKGGKVTEGAKGMNVRLEVDALTSITLGYGTDRTKLEAVTLFRELGGDKMRALNALTSMLLTTMAAFESPQKAGVPDVMTKLCGSAMKKEGSDFKEKVQDKEISCFMNRGVIVLSVY